MSWWIDESAGRFSIMHGEHEADCGEVAVAYDRETAEKIRRALDGTPHARADALEARCKIAETDRDGWELANRALEAQCAAMLALLRKLEWSGGQLRQRCPYEPCGHYTPGRHAPSCAMAAALASDAGKRLLEEHAAEVALLKSSAESSGRDRQRVDEAARVAIQEAREWEAKWLQATMNAKKAARDLNDAVSGNYARRAKAELERDETLKALRYANDRLATAEQVVAAKDKRIGELTQALEVYGLQASWESDAAGGISEQVFTYSQPSYRNEPGYKLARITLGWEYPPPEPCHDPRCDGVKDDPTFPGDGPDGLVHRCFKDGRWLDDGSEM